MSKSLRYIVLDCETATLPFANTIANGDSEIKKKIAIARPLIYDLGWVVTNRKGEILKKANYLIAEIFSVPSVFNTAYYADKRPIYLDMLNRGEIAIKPWNDVIKEFINDAENVDGIGAFNSMFDFKKAIPFTDLYISKLYSPDYYRWEKAQYTLCEHIAFDKKKKSDNNFEPDVFRFHNKVYPLFDIWGLATTHLLNTVNYKSTCIKNDYFTNSGVYFKTSAEVTYRYLQDKYNFIEAHTALDDAIIETYILSRIAARHAITMGIKYFPFRDLGTTIDFCKRKKKVDVDECNKVIDKINEYIDSKEDEGISNYIQMLITKVAELEELMGI